jgi:small subunit ribosomal protein S4
MKRNSEYGKLLRNKQVLKRSYMLSEKQFAKLVQKTSAKYSKNNNMSHDAALYLFLEDRMDSIIYRAGFAKTIIQARQMISHGHFLLNGKKHNIPSTFLKVGDKITLKPKMKESPLYAGATVSKTFKVPSWIKVDRNKYEIELLTLPVL